MLRATIIHVNKPNDLKFLRVSHRIASIVFTSRVRIYIGIGENEAVIQQQRRAGTPVRPPSLPCCCEGDKNAYHRREGGG